jgi:hypothetical protein
LKPLATKTPPMYTDTRSIKDEISFGKETPAPVASALNKRRIERKLRRVLDGYSKRIKLFGPTLDVV